MRTNKLKSAAVLVVLAVFSAQLFAGDLVRRVIFPKGKSLVTYTGKLPGEYAEYHAYVVNLKKGQHLNVKLNSDDPEASFTVYETKKLGPADDLLFDSRLEGREASVITPLTSEYSIQVYGVKDSDSAASGKTYSVEISVTN